MHYTHAEVPGSSNTSGDSGGRRPWRRSKIQYNITIRKKAFYRITFLRCWNSMHFNKTLISDLTASHSSMYKKKKKAFFYHSLQAKWFPQVIIQVWAKMVPTSCKQLTCHISLGITNDLSLRIRATSCHIPSQASLQMTVQLLFSNNHKFNPYNVHITTIAVHFYVVLTLLYVLRNPGWGWNGWSNSFTSNPNRPISSVIASVTWRQTKHL